MPASSPIEVISNRNEDFTRSNSDRSVERTEVARDRVMTSFPTKRVSDLSVVLLGLRGIEQWIHSRLN